MGLASLLHMVEAGFQLRGPGFPTAAGWQISAPLDTAAWMWIIFATVFFGLALSYEDVRDMEGDRAAERRTQALVIGPTFVRCWFATLMVLLPFAFYFVPARLSGTGDWRGVMSAVVLGLLSWTCAARAVLRCGRSADRVTYELFCLLWGLTLATATLLLARS